jgi:hypothetical protein
VVGYKQMSSDWKPADAHFEFGLVDFDIRPPDWPVSLVAQLLLSYADETPGVPGDFCGTCEFNAGIRKVWNCGPNLQPFLGGGLSAVGASTTTQLHVRYYDSQGHWFYSDWHGYHQEDSDIGIGYWVSGGVYFLFNKNWHVGAQVQYSAGNIHLFSHNLDAGGVHGMLMIGINW